MTRQAKRNRLVRWLRDALLLSRQRSATVSRSVIRVEPLEARQLLAGDGLRSLLASCTDAVVSSAAETPAQQSTVVPAASVASEIEEPLPVASAIESEAEGGEGELSPEGEDEADLVAFAQALADSGTRFFGAVWCPACEAQRALFEDGAKFLPFVEVTNNQRDLNSVGQTEGIQQYPTWEFPDGTRLGGIQTLETLSQRSGVAIPQSSTPSVDTLPDVDLVAGSPLHIPIDAYDPNGNPLTITVSSSNESVVSAEVLTGNRSLVINTEGFGDMVFELFEQRAPVPAGRVIELAEAGFYDGIIWHRVVDGFVIQGGDPTGTGSGGSTLGNFDDQFDLDLLHNRGGLLSYAKSTDDTNDSQFFVTETETPHLDFNHSIFGVLVEGENVREAISNVANSGSPSNRPTPFMITMESADIFDDQENGTVFLKANASSGSSTITVRIEDTEGNVVEESFTANVVAEDASLNRAPFLEPIGTVETEINTPVTINLPGVDKEGDTLIYSATALAGQPAFGLDVNQSTGAVTVTPPTGFSGQLQFAANLAQTVPVTQFSSPDDNQIVTVQVNATNVPTSVDLDPASDTGDDNDNITNATSLSFTVNGTVAGALVEIRAGGNVVGSATASGETTTVTVADVSGLGEGAVAFTSRQTIDNVESQDSPALTVVLDRTGPASVVGTTIPSSQLVDTLLSIDLQHPEEGQGLVYGLASAPQGMQLSTDGVLTWTPTSSQLGEQTFQLTLQDAAGNSSQREFTINVIEEPVIRVRPVAVDLNGNPLTAVSAGDSFKVQVLVQDLRNFTIAEGVFSASYDFLFDPAVVELVNDPITYLGPYTGQQRGTIGDGIIDELSSISTSLDPLGNDERAQLEVEFRAIQSGNPNIRLEPPDIASSENLLYGDNNRIPSTQVNFQSLDLQVGVDFELADDTFNFDEDSGQQTLNVLDNDTNNTNLTVVSVGERSSGAAVTISNDGRSLLYTPTADFTGGDSFTYRASNANGVELEATVTVQIADVNDPPVALNDTFSVFSGSNNNILEVLDNDSVGADDPAAETLRVTAISNISNNGAVVVSTGGLSINYSPATGFEGTETFSYTLSDGRGGEATGTVSVTVVPENPPPTVVNDNFTLAEDDAQATFDVLANDSSDDPSETLSIVDVTNSQRGSLFQVSSDGSEVVYQPAADFSGVEILSYTVRDSNGAEAIGAVTFTVTAVNDPPIAVDDSETVIAANASTTIDVLANDSTSDEGETLSVASVTQPTDGNGTVEISSDGTSVIYRPPTSEFEGTVTFDYTVSDGNGLTADATVTLQVEDFLPRRISGVVTAGSGNGVFGRVSLSLKGTDVTGAAIDTSITTNADGSYEFPELAPGDYELQRAPLPFLNDAGETVQITSGVTDSDAVSDLVVSGSLRPQHFDIRDFFGSAFANSLLVAVDDSGETAWSAGVGEWSTLSQFEVTPDTESSDQYLISASNADSTSLSGTLNVGSTESNAYQAGREGSVRLLRVRGTPESAGIIPESDTGATGEGEAVPTPVIQSASGSAISSGTTEEPFRRRNFSSAVDQAIVEEF